jgi:DNA-binding transcriptional LysR family regulator
LLDARGNSGSATRKRITDIVAAIENDIKELKGIQRGQPPAECSRVPSATLVPLAVTDFKEQYPETEISIKTGRPYEIEQWILAKDVDQGVIEGDPASSLILKEPWYADELVLVLPRRSHFLKRRRLSLKEVVEEPFYYKRPGAGTPLLKECSPKGALSSTSPSRSDPEKPLKLASPPVTEYRCCQNR